MLVFFSGCVRAVREERREQGVDTGTLVSFSAEAQRRWDFGDGAPPAQGQVVSHAFARGGRFLVKAFEGERVTDRISVLVQVRHPFHAVAPDAEAALVFRSLDELAPSVDFLERIGSAATVQRLLDSVPLVAFALEPGAVGRSSLDPLEGLGVYLPTGAAGLVSFVGVVDDALAKKAFGEWLVDHGYRPDGEGSFSGPRGRLLVLVDRGTLFAVIGETVDDLQRLSQAVRRAPALGLEADGATAGALSDLASGGVAVLVRPQASTRASARVKPAGWTLGVGALRFERDSLRLVARALGPQPLWSTPPAARPQRLLAHAPEGAIAALSVDAPLVEVLKSVGVPLDDGDDEGPELRGALAVLSRRVDVSMSFDVEGFLAATIAAGGRPAPRVTVLGETSAPDRLPVAALIDRVLSRRQEPFDTASQRAFQLWRTRGLDHPLELALDADTLYLRFGRRLADTRSVDLVAELARRSEGACGSGHLTALIDVGQLKRDVLQPRLVPGVDSRKVVTTQALTATFLQQLTQVEQLFVDVGPAPFGATIFAELKLTPSATAEPATR
jgi:hypothetical protein